MKPLEASGWGMTMKWVLGLAASAAALGVFHAANAEPYVDYTPKKGAWEVQTMAVDPNHVDEYLTGLKKTMVPVLEIEKAHGTIDRYSFMVKLNPNGGGANIMIVQHYPSLAAMDPDKARDQMIEKEIYANLPKADEEKKVAEYEKYRKFLSDELWTDVEMGK
jgi:hypothetical protein